MPLSATLPRIASPSRSVGAIAFDRLCLVEKLGEGAYTEVWKVHDSIVARGGRFLALKTLSQFYSETPDVALSLEREARLARELDHPNILRPLSVLRDAFGIGILTEFADDSLATLQQRRPHQVFEPDQLRPYIRQVGEGLDYLHHWGVIHRDLKPHNLLVFSCNNRLKIADLGISSVVSELAESSEVFTMPSGSIAYMSPQQLNNEHPGARDDIYSFGATLYELLTGKPPFYSGHIARQIEIRTPDSIDSRRKMLNKPVASIPRQWNSVILACLEKDPANRPENIRDAMDALLSPPGRASPAGGGLSALRPLPRLPAKISTTAIALISFAMGAAAAVLLSR